MYVRVCLSVCVCLCVCVCLSDSHSLPVLYSTSSPVHLLQRSRHKDKEREKKKKESDALSHVMQLNKMHNPEPVKKRSKLVLPTPQISDQELSDVSDDALKTTVYSHSLHCP